MTARKQAFVRIVSRGPNPRWFVHPELRTRIVEDATSLGLSLNDRVCQILAGRYGVPYETRQRKTAPEKTAEELNLSIPWPLYDKVQAAADKARRSSRKPYTASDEIRRVLSAKYGLPLPDGGTRRGPTAAAAKT